MSVSKRQRISKKIFDEVFSSGRWVNSSFFGLSVLKNEKKEEKSRFSFVVSKKIANSAHLRNKLRRRGYSALRKHVSEIFGGFLVIIYLKKEGLSLSFDQFSDGLGEILKKGGLKD